MALCEQAPSYFCPSCGEFKQDIDEQTGFCLECIGSTQTRCINCDSLFKKDQPHRKLCPYCREERWLERNADRLEEFLIAGATIKFAKREVYHENRPVCLSCGQPIELSGSSTNQYGDTQANFCGRTLECRRWKYRYRRLRQRNRSKGVIDPTKQALSQVAAEIYTEKGGTTMKLTT